jgi:sorting nexin-4
MLGDEEDVFDSVTWETPAAPSIHAATHSGPGFRQSTVDSEEGQGPHDPKWEGYLITSVKDPVKELAETKDAYVSYSVSAKVRPGPINSLVQSSHGRTPRQIFPYSRRLHHQLVGAFKTLCF